MEQEGKVDATRRADVILERGRAAYKRKMREDVRKLSDELTGDFYVFPLTIVEKQRLVESFEKGKLLSLARMIVVRAKEQDGTPIFADLDHKEISRSWEAEDVERIAKLIQGDDDDEDGENGTDSKAIETAEEVQPGS